MGRPEPSPAYAPYRDPEGQDGEIDSPPPYDLAATLSHPQSPPTGPAPAYAPIRSSNSNPFPPSFAVISQGLFTSTHILGPDKNHPVYSMSLHTFRRPNIILHSGPDKTFSPLATLDIRSLSSRLDVTFPPHTPSLVAGEGRGSIGSNGLFSANSSGSTSTRAFSSDPVMESTTSAWSGFSNKHVFSIEVDPQTHLRETFEWRGSRGDAIKGMLDGVSYGWKLARLASGPPPAALAMGMGASTGEGKGKEGLAFFPGGATTSDGKEVVAAFGAPDWSWSTETRFVFLGTGASGLLGERWAIMAVITALGIAEMERQAGNSA